MREEDHPSSPPSLIPILRYYMTWGYVIAQTFFQFSVVWEEIRIYVGKEISLRKFYFKIPVRAHFSHYWIINTQGGNLCLFLGFIFRVPYSRAEYLVCSSHHLTWLPKHSWLLSPERWYVWDHSGEAVRCSWSPLQCWPLFSSPEGNIRTWPLSGVTMCFCQQPGPGAKGKKGGGDSLSPPDILLGPNGLKRT